MTVHPRNAISKRGGPITSFEAEEQITRRGVRDTQARIVLMKVRRHPGETSAGLAARTDWLVGILDRYVVARRLSDLEFLGLVKKGPPAIGPNGRRGVTWYPVSPGEQGRLLEEETP